MRIVAVSILAATSLAICGSRFEGALAGDAVVSAGRTVLSPDRLAFDLSAGDAVLGALLVPSSPSSSSPQPTRPPATSASASRTLSVVSVLRPTDFLRPTFASTVQPLIAFISPASYSHSSRTTSQAPLEEFTAANKGSG